MKEKRNTQSCDPATFIHQGKAAQSEEVWPVTRREAKKAVSVEFHWVMFSRKLEGNNQGQRVKADF